MKIEYFLQDKSRWWGLMIMVFALGAGWIFISRVPQAAAANEETVFSPREGFFAPDFTLDLLEGGQVTLSDLRGQAVMINIWTTWCPPCRAEMPSLEAVYQDHKENGLIVLAVNSTNQDSEARVAEFVTEFGLSFPVALDRNGAMSTRYRLRGLPSSFFLDRSGVIRSVVIGGPMSESLIRSKVQEIIKEDP